MEEIVYEAGRHALADQEALVAGIRQRTGTLLAAHALVASFLGAEALRTANLGFWTWFALAALCTGLVLAVLVLAPWNLAFAIDPTQLVAALHRLAARDVGANELTAVVELGHSYERLRDHNAPMVKRMSRLSTALAVATIPHTAGWIAALLGVAS